MNKGTGQLSVLITGIGSTGAQSLAKAFRLYDKCALKILGCDADEKTAGKYFVDQFVKVPYADEPEYASELLNICTSKAVDLLIPVMEKELEIVAENKAAFLKYRPVVSDVNVIRTCNDKLLTDGFLNSLGIPTPFLYRDANKAKFPFIVKPRKGTGSRGIDVFKENCQFSGREVSGDFIIQAYVSGKEYTIDTYSTLRGELIGVVPRQRLTVKGGLSVNTITVDNPLLAVYTSRIVEALPIIGPANIQFIESEQGDFFCTDVNPRIGGGYIASIRAGLNAPFFLIDEVRGLPVSFPSYIKGLRMMRYWEEIYEG